MARRPVSRRGGAALALAALLLLGGCALSDGVRVSVDDAPYQGADAAAGDTNCSAPGRDVERDTRTYTPFLDDALGIGRFACP